MLDDGRAMKFLIDLLTKAEGGTHEKFQTRTVESQMRWDEFFYAYARSE